MNNSLSRFAGLTLLGAALAGTGESQAGDGPTRMTRDVYEVLGGKSTLMNPKFTPANGHLSDLNPETLENAFFLEPFGEWSDMATAVETHTDDLLMIQSGPSYTEYNLYSYAGKRDGKPLFRFAGAENVCDSLPNDTYTGYYEINGRRFYVLPDQTGTSSGTCPSELTAVAAKTGEGAKTVMDVNATEKTGRPPETPTLMLHGTSQEKERLSGPGQFMNLDESTLSGAKFSVEKNGKHETLSFLSFDATGGRVRAVFPSNSTFAGQCAVVVEYENITYDADGVPTFMLFNDMRTRREPCTEAPVAVTQSEPKQEKSHPLSLAPLAPSRINAWLMGDLEDTYLPYSEGVAPGVTVGAEWSPLRRGAVLPGLTFGVSADAIFSGEGSGMEGVQGTLGYRGGRVGVFALAGMSFEPRVPDSALNDAPSVGLMATVDVLKLPAGFDVTGFAQGEQQFFGQEPGTFNVSVGFGATYNLDVQPSVRAPREPRVETPVALEVSGSRVVRSTVPFSGDVSKASFKTPDEVEQAEHVRLSEEMRKLAQRNAWKAVEADYQRTVELKIQPSYKDYMLGAEAARALGDIKESYLRLQAASKLDPTKECLDWMADVEANYASVVLEVEDGYKGNSSFIAVTPPFPPDQRAALSVLPSLEEGDSFEGFIPTSTEYTFGGQTVNIAPLGVSEEGKPRQTEVIRLED